MDSCYDERTQRTVVIEPPEPVMVLVSVAFTIIVSFPLVEEIRERDPVGIALLGASWVFLFVLTLCLAPRAVTKVVATFDGKARTLTITRTRPWQRTQQAFHYEDIVAVAPRKRLVLGGGHASLIISNGRGLDITLTGGRRIRLRAYRLFESDEAADHVRLAMPSSSGSSAP